MMKNNLREGGWTPYQFYSEETSVHVLIRVQQQLGQRSTPFLDRLFVTLIIS